jgi:hypothetical protein
MSSDDASDLFEIKLSEMDSISGNLTVGKVHAYIRHSDINAVSIATGIYIYGTRLIFGLKIIGKIYVLKLFPFYQCLHSLYCLMQIYFLLEI